MALVMLRKQLYKAIFKPKLFPTKIFLKAPSKENECNFKGELATILYDLLDVCCFC